MKKQLLATGIMTVVVSVAKLLPSSGMAMPDFDMKQLGIPANVNTDSCLS